MRPTGILLAAALAALAFVPSASALSWVPPPQPDPRCEPTPPGNGTSLEDEVKDILHDGTTLACNSLANADDVVGIGYTFTVNQVNIVVNAIRGPIDQTQDNFCSSVHGDPNHPAYPHCRDIVVDLSGVSVNHVEPEPIWV